MILYTYMVSHMAVWLYGSIRLSMLIVKYGVLLEQHPPHFDPVLFEVDLPQIVYDYI